jgi:hypothetical protein
MAKYTERNANTGRLSEVLGTEQSTGIAQAGAIPQLAGNGRFHPSLMPPGFGDDSKAIEASETLASGAFVNVFDDAGVTKVRNADANSPDKEAHGYVVQSFTAAELANVYFEGTNTAATGATGGKTYFLSDTTPGGFTDVPVLGATKLSQILGRSVGTNEINFEGEPAITLA